MPYYIYRIISGDTANTRTLELAGEHQNYREAKNEVRALRMSQAKDSGLLYRIIFADNQPEAEQRLLEHRDKPILKEWEI
jgi:hypothetical protein